MSQRINISIPIELYDRVKPFREKINMSKLCQEAIEKEVTKREEFDKRIGQSPEIEEIIKRLRSEKMAFRDEVSDLGVSDGIVWAKIAHYRDIREAEMEGINSHNFPSGAVGDQIHDYMRKKLRIKKEKDLIDITDEDLEDHKILFQYIGIMIPNFEISEEDSAEFTMLYYEGFYKGVREFWHSICGLI